MPQFSELGESKIAQAHENVNIIVFIKVTKFLYRIYKEQDVANEQAWESLVKSRDMESKETYLDSFKARHAHDNMSLVPMLASS